MFLPNVRSPRKKDRSRCTRNKAKAAAKNRRRRARLTPA